MDQRDAMEHLNRMVDGQMLRITTNSGRAFEGIYDGEQSSLEDGLYFETMDGKELRADWVNVDAVSFRSARAITGSMVVPPEHPLSGQAGKLRAYTVRNPVPGVED